MNIFFMLTESQTNNFRDKKNWSNAKQAQVCVSACTGFRKFQILNEQRAMRPAPTQPGVMVVGTPGGQGAVVGTPVQVPGKVVA